MIDYQLGSLSVLSSSGPCPGQVKGQIRIRNVRDRSFDLSYTIFLVFTLTSNFLAPTGAQGEGILCMHAWVRLCVCQAHYSKEH